MDSSDNMRGQITKYIVLAGPQDSARTHIGYLEQWDDEACDEYIDAIGRAKGKDKTGDGKLVKNGEKGETARKGSFSGKCDWCEEVGHRAAA